MLVCCFVCFITPIFYCVFFSGARQKTYGLREVSLPHHALPVAAALSNHFSGAIPAEPKRNAVQENDEEIMECFRFDPDADEAQIQQVNFETAKPPTKFQESQTCSFGQAIPFARKGRISESPTYDNLRVPSNGNVIGCPSVLARAGETNIRCAIAGPDATHSAISAAHQQQRALWIRQGGQDYDVPYDLPHCFVSDFEHYNSSRPISCVQMPREPLPGIKTEIRDTDDVQIKAGSLEQFRQLSQFNYNAISQLCHFHNWTCKQMVLVKDGSLLLSRFFNQLVRRLRNQRLVVGALAESSSALCDAVSVQVRRMIASKCDL